MTFPDHLFKLSGQGLLDGKTEALKISHGWFLNGVENQI
jgi:hypothetical protein